MYKWQRSGQKKMIISTNTEVMIEDSAGSRSSEKRLVMVFV